MLGWHYKSQVQADSLSNRVNITSQVVPRHQLGKPVSVVGLQFMQLVVSQKPPQMNVVVESLIKKKKTLEVR